MIKMLCCQRHGGTCRQPVSPPDYACRYPGHNKGEAHMHGKAGGSLNSNQAKQKFGEARKAGFKGEQAVSKILWETFKDDPAVHIFQDVNIPEGHGANADFLVVKGNTVIVVDAKMWAPGFYWSSFWRPDPLPHKGPSLKPFEAAVGTNGQGKKYTSKTVAMAVDVYRKMLTQRTGSTWNVKGAYLFVPPSSRSESWRGIRVWALNLHGAAKLVAGNPTTPKKLKAMLPTKADDNEAALQALQGLTR